MNALSLVFALAASAQQPAPVYQLERVCSNADGSVTYTKETSMPRCGIPNCAPYVAPLETWKVDGKAVLDAQVAAITYTHLGTTGERALKEVTLVRANGAAFASGATEIKDVLVCRINRLPPPPPGAHPGGGR